MPRSNPSIRTFLGAIVLSAGVATPLALADEQVKQDEPALSDLQPQQESSSDEKASSSDRESADYVEVRVSLPDGRSFTRLEPKRNLSARYTRPGSSPASTSRRLADGSRISVGSRGVSGGSNSSSVRVGGGSGGGGSSASSAGGGGGGGGASTASKDSSSSAATGAPQSASASGGGIFAFGETESQSAGRQTVPTVGDPTYDREGNATGGQRVEFHDAGMSAAVIGTRVYFNNVELVVADQPFEVVTGTRLEHNSAIMEDRRLASGSSDSLSSFNTRSSSIKLDFERDTIVTLMLYTQSQNSFNPDREMRTWTVRIR